MGCWHSQRYRCGVGVDVSRHEAGFTAVCRKWRGVATATTATATAIQDMALTAQNTCSNVNAYHKTEALTSLKYIVLIFLMSSLYKLNFV